MDPVRQSHVKLSAARFNRALAARKLNLDLKHFLVTGLRGASVPGPYNPRQLDALNLAVKRQAIQDAMVERNAEAKSLVRAYKGWFPALPGRNPGTYEVFKERAKKVDAAQRAIHMETLKQNPNLLVQFNLDNPSFLQRIDIYNEQKKRLRSPERIKVLNLARTVANDIYRFRYRDVLEIAWDIMKTSWREGKK
jgi:hypothetical protein